MLTILPSDLGWCCGESTLPRFDSRAWCHMWVFYLACSRRSVGKQGAIVQADQDGNQVTKIYFSLFDFRFALPVISLPVCQLKACNRIGFSLLVLFSAPRGLSPGTPQKPIFGIWLIWSSMCRWIGRLGDSHLGLWHWAISRNSTLSTFIVL